MTRRFDWPTMVTAFGLTLLLATACGEAPSVPTAMPTPTSTPTAAPTETASPLSPTPSATLIPAPTDTPTATPSPTPTSTPTPIPTYTLSGVVFFDYNGNGLRDEGEPPIEGVPITAGGLSTASGLDGSYSLGGVSAGTQAVYVESPTQEPTTAFRYISLSLEAFQPIEEPINVRVSGNTSLDIALMQGYLTLPCKPDIPICVISYFDLAGDSEDGIVRDWMGNTTIRTDPRDCTPGKVYDFHPGIDYAYGTDYAQLVAFEVYAVAPGVIVLALPPDPQYKGGDVRIRHIDGRTTYCNHTGELFVTEGQTVSRGQRLARIWLDWDEPHLHLGTMGKEGEGRRQWDYWRLPMYRDPLDPESVSYWTVDNNPQYASQYTP